MYDVYITFCQIKLLLALGIKLQLRFLFCISFGSYNRTGVILYEGAL